MNRHFKKTAIAALCGVAMGLSGCGSDDTDTTSSTTSSSITTTPSLGQISNATVTIYQADGSTVLGSGEIGANGAVTINFSGYSGAVVIEVAGDADAQYFDEASGTLVSFPAPQKLRAMAPTASGSFAVSILTELAYQGAVNKNLLPLDANEVNALNNKVRTALIPEIADLLTAPTLFNAGTTSGSLGNNDAGKYALKLAALAKLGNGQAAPALAVMQALAADLADGDIDGLNGSGGSVGAPYGNFATEFSTAIGSMANGYGSSELKAALTNMPAMAFAIDFTYTAPTTGGTGGGSNNGGSTSSNLTCNTSLFQTGAAVATPTSADWISFAGVYAAQEGSFDDNFNFVATGTVMPSLSVAGELLYKGSTAVPLTSACVETLSGGGKQLVLHTAKGHLDFGGMANGKISGVSPEDGITIVKQATTNNTTGGTTGSNPTTGSSCVTVPGNRFVDAAGVLREGQYSVKKFVDFTSATTKISIIDYGDTIGVSAVDSGFSIGAKPMNGCILKYNPSWTDTMGMLACSDLGINFDRSAGTLSFTNTPMQAIIFTCPGDCKLNGSLKFPAY